MRKTKKALASLAIAGMVLSMAPMSVFGATDVTRLSDADRVGTAIAIAANGWTSADNVIVVPADDANIVDALAAAPLAGQLNAPILVTYKGALDPKVQQKIVDLKAKNVYAVGALSADTVASLKAISGVNVTALQGADRTETAAKVAAQLTNIKGSFVVAYNGVADAMSAASYAAANGYSILVENPDATLPANEAQYKGAKQYTVGGQAKLDGATALAGADRYATNDAVVKALDYKYDKVYVANGESLVDALAGASLAAKTNSPIVLANATKAATGVNDKVTASTQVVALGGVGAVPEAVRTQVGKQAPTGTVSVQSVKAVSATSFKVVFTAAPADTSKVSIAVTRGTTPVTTTVAWNDAKTEATVSSSQNLPEGSYNVAVKNDATDLGTSTVTVEAQKIASIKITSEKLGVTSSGAIGYATYSVLDQYGNDITTASLANNVQFQTGVGTATGKDGLIKVEAGAGINLVSFSTVVLSAYDSTSGVTTSATLATSTQVGTISDIQLKSLTNADGKTLTAGDTTTVFYADFTATDMSGNPTNNYDLITNGLITKNNDKETLTTSADTYVSAKIVRDPVDSNKALIEVKATSSTVTMDLPVVITAMTWTGKTSSLNVTLKKAASVDTVTLMAPAYDIAINESKEIPFTAVDQNGNPVTKFSDFKDDSGNLKVNFTNATLSARADGTAVLKNTAVGTDGPLVITATTNTGKYSTITINIQKAAIADQLAVDSTKLISAMQKGSSQKIDTGVNYGGLTVKDQYGRVMNLQDATSAYKIIATTSGAVAIDSTNNAVTGTGYIQINADAVKVGASTVTFQLVAKAAPTVVIDQKSVSISVVKDTDIVDYTIDAVASPIYTTTSGAVTWQNDAYAAHPKVYGKTSSGAKVVIANAVQDVYLDNTKDFQLDTLNGSIGAYDSVYVAAKPLDNNRTSATTKVTVAVLGTDGGIHTVTTTVNSSTTDPVATDLLVSASTDLDGLTVDGDVITVKRSLLPTYFNNKYMARFTETGAKNRAGVYIYAKDSYGTKALKLANFYLGADNTAAGHFSIDSNGLVTTDAAMTPGSYVYVTGVTTNGLVKTIKLVFVD